ncbi:MAG: hypothetical protein AB7T86_10795 [Xanthobacteraceae bacterium]|uniref:hypothetical protein n=1 Tax=Pseudolabrys sp. TaxID=1960880 RepID=UPI003D0E1890
MRLHMMTIAATATTLLVSSAAFAAMTIDETHYEAGVLVVRGKTAPGTEVAVDGRYKKKAEDDGTFIFRLNYKPNKCRVLITAGENNETRDVTNCTDPSDKKVDPKPGTPATPQPK